VITNDSPVYVEETVTDIDVVYSTGPQNFTLYGADSYKDTPTKIVITLASPLEVITLFKTPMHGYSVRQRVIKRLVKGPSPAVANLAVAERA